MQKYLILLLINFFSSCQAQSVLWSISDSNYNVRGYIFGSAHIASVKYKNVCNRADSILDSVQLLVIESDISSDINPELFKLLLSSDVESIKNYLNDNEYKWLDSILLSTVSVPLSVLDRLQPLILSAFIELASVSSSDTFFKMEEVLVSSALEKKKQIDYFETVREQLNCISSIPYIDQMHILKSQIRSVDQEDLLMNLYENGDVHGIAKYSKNNIPPGAYDVLLTNRNIKMATYINKVLKVNSALFVVGAAHLGGKDGILSLLESKGFLLKAIK